MKIDDAFKIVYSTGYFNSTKDKKNIAKATSKLIKETLHQDNVINLAQKLKEKSINSNHNE